MREDMIFSDELSEKFYQKYEASKRLLEKGGIPRDCFGYESGYAIGYPGFEDILNTLDKIFTSHSSTMGVEQYYRNFFEIMRLTIFLKNCSIKLRELEVLPDRVLTLSPVEQLHHNPELTSHVLSQLPDLRNVRFGGVWMNGGADVASNDHLVEVGDTKVSKVEEYLKCDCKVWIITLKKTKGTYSLSKIYGFSRGNNYEFMKQWLDREKADDSEYMASIISNLDWMGHKKVDKNIFSTSH